MNTKLRQARHDPVICLASGLFRSLKRGDYKKLKLDIVYEFGKKDRVEFSGPEPLGAEDLRVLQGLVAMAGPKERGMILKEETKSEEGKFLRSAMDLKWQAIHDNAMVVKGSFYELAQIIGYPTNCGASLEIMEKCLERLWKVSIIVQSGSVRRGFHLLSYYGSDSSDGKLCVALNCRITESILGNNPYTRIDMDEVRKLKTSPAHILHQKLSAIVPPGGSRLFKPETLADYIWPEPASGSAQRKRRAYLKKALTEIAATGGWKVEDGYLIKRNRKNNYVAN